MIYDSYNKFLILINLMINYQYYIFVLSLLNQSFNSQTEQNDSDYINMDYLTRIIYTFLSALGFIIVDIGFFSLIL